MKKKLIISLPIIILVIGVVIAGLYGKASVQRKVASIISPTMVAYVITAHWRGLTLDEDGCVALKYYLSVNECGHECIQGSVATWRLFPQVGHTIWSYNVRDAQKI